MNKKLKKVLIIAGTIVLSINAFFAIVNIIPPAKVLNGKTNPFISTSGTPMIVAHRGGCDLNPENTMKAYRASVNEYNVDIVEADFWLTKDNQLVCNHDDNINRMTDVEYFYPNASNKISDFTVEELKNFNFGHQFETLDDKTPYKDYVSIDDPNRKNKLEEVGLQIVKTEELFNEFYESHPNLKFVVEIKNSGEKGLQAADILADLLNTKFPEYKDQIVVGTFNDEVEKHLKENYPDIMRGASTGAATSFIVTQLLRVNIFDSGDFTCLQIPMERVGLNLAKKTYIKRAHRRNIAVQYWTINDEDEMRELIELGCDAIMTDNPSLLQEVLKDYQ